MSTTYQDDPASLTATLPGTYCPFTDVIVPDPYRDIVDGLRLAFYRPLRVPGGAHPLRALRRGELMGGRAGSMIAWMSAPTPARRRRARLGALHVQGRTRAGGGDPRSAEADAGRRQLKPGVREGAKESFWQRLKPEFEQRVKQA